MSVYITAKIMVYCDTCKRPVCEMMVPEVNLPNLEKASVVCVNCVVTEVVGLRVAEPAETAKAVPTPKE